MKQRIAALTASVVLCLTLISIYLTCGMYARYTTNGANPEQARVAKFGQLSLAMDATENVKLLPGSTESVTLDPRVSMTASEVAVAVYVYVTLPENSGWSYNEDTKSFSCGPILWKVEDAWFYLEKNDELCTYTFYQILAPGEALVNERIVVNGTMTVPQNYDDYYHMTDTDANMKIRFKTRAAQVD